MLLLPTNSPRFCKYILIFSGFAEDGEKKGLTSVNFKSSNIEPFTYIKHRVHGVNNEPQTYFS